MRVPEDVVLIPNWLAIALYCAGNRESFIWLRSDKDREVSVDAVGISIAVSSRRPGTGAGADTDSVAVVGIGRFGFGRSSWNRLLRPNWLVIA